MPLARISTVLLASGEAVRPRAKVLAGPSATVTPSVPVMVTSAPVPPPPATGTPMRPPEWSWSARRRMVSQ